MGGLFELESKEPNNDKSSLNSATGIWTLLKSRSSDEAPWVTSVKEEIELKHPQLQKILIRYAGWPLLYKLSSVLVSMDVFRSRDGGDN